MTLIITGVIDTFHCENSSCHNASNGYFIGHLNAAYFLDKLEDLQSDFMTRTLVMCFTETYLVQGPCIDE